MLGRRLTSFLGPHFQGRAEGRVDEISCTVFFCKGGLVFSGRAFFQMCVFLDIFWIRGART